MIGGRGLGIPDWSGYKHKSVGTGVYEVNPYSRHVMEVSGVDDKFWEGMK